MKEVRIGRHPDGSLKGFCHVEFYENSSADKAVMKTGSKIEGRALKIDYAGSKPIQTGRMTPGGLRATSANDRPKEK